MSIQDLTPVLRPLPPQRLRSRSITRAHRYYARLRLLATMHRSPRFLHSFLGPPFPRRDPQLSQVPACSHGQARLGAPHSGGRMHTRLGACTRVACERLETLGTFPRRSFRSSPPSVSASPVTFPPRLLSCLRINCAVTRTAARLDSRPVASGYRSGFPTRKNTRPCLAATKTRPLARGAGSGLVLAHAP